MILTLRKRHRRIFIFLGIALPLLFCVGLLMRNRLVTLSVEANSHSSPAKIPSKIQ